MRTLAIGDIHGCLRALDGVLELVRPEADDLIVFLGDYVDRGPDSRGVLERLMELARRCRCVFLRGNHDQMMLDARCDPVALSTWLPFGGRQTLESYARDGNSGTLDDVPGAHWQFLDGTLPYYEDDTHFFVHANAHYDIPLDEQSPMMLFWEKLHPDYTAPHFSGKIMVCGHTAQKSGVPLDLGHAICIDTFVYGTGWLTCLDVHSVRLWQGRMLGETRSGRLGGWLEDVD
jgi:serine/threonine protein phosphatase 1